MQQFSVTYITVTVRYKHMKCHLKASHFLRWLKRAVDSATLISDYVAAFFA
jgi:hypothetical protein